MYLYVPYVPLQISDLKSGRSGYLSENGRHIIWNDNTISNLGSNYEDLNSLSLIKDEIDREIAEILSVKNVKPKQSAVCKKCNFLNEYKLEDPDYICYKCKNF